MIFLKKIIEYCLYVLVFLLPLQTRWIIKAGEINGGYSEYGTISLYGADILLILLLFLFIIFKWRTFNREEEKENFRIAPYWWFIAIIDVFIFVSIFFASDKILALFIYGRFLLGIGLFWLVIGAVYDKTKLMVSFLAGAAMQAFLGIYQFLVQASFSNKWLGLAIHGAEELGASVVETGDERWLRAYGGLDHPNVLGGVLAVGIILAAGLLINRAMKEKANSVLFFNYNLNSGGTIKLFGWFFILIFFIGLFFSFSRSAWLGLAVGMLVMLAMAITKKNLLMQKRLLEIILVLGVLFFILASQYSNLVSARFMGEERLEIKSSEERVESYQDSWRLIKARWLFGVGAGNYTLAAHEKIQQNEPGYFYQPVHNTFLLIWSEAGLFGLTGFMALLVYLLIFNFRFLKVTDGVFNMAIIFVIVTIAMFDHWWWSLHFGVLFFWFLTGLTIRSFLYHNGPASKLSLPDKEI